MRDHTPSKVVLRYYDAPGGERCQPLTHGADSFRFPSLVAARGNRLYFGRERGARDVPQDAVWYDSIKMRVAAKHGATARAAYYGAMPAGVNPPAGLSFEELMTLAIAWLLGKARAGARTLVVGPGKGQLDLGVTMGLPTDLYFDLPLRTLFLSIIRAAWAHDLAPYTHPHDNNGLVCDQPLLDHTRRLLREQRAQPLDLEYHDYWLRPEALAAIWWAWASPTTTAGPYLKVDIGAGTTNVAAFMVCDRAQNGPPVKSHLAVFAASSGNVGMDAISGTHYQVAPTRPLAAMHPLNHACWKSLRPGLEAPYRRVFDAVRKKTGGGGLAWNQWRDRAKILHLGGGSRFDQVRTAFVMHPQFTNNPPQLCGPLGAPVDMPLHHTRLADARCDLMVAYGLSVLGGNMPKVTAPAEIEALPPPRRLDYAAGRDMYGK